MKLKKIADGMRAEIEADSFGHTKRQLGGGLMLVLFHNDVRWRLTLRRINVYPSEREINICEQAFDVPAGTEPARRLWSERVDAHRTVTWYCIDLIWRKAELPLRMSPCATTA